MAEEELDVLASSQDSPLSPNTPSDTPTDDENAAATDAAIQVRTAKIIEVKCGPLYAKMHVELFLCPGIHQPCIELEGEMISPKEFTVRANKDKQKDWKGSIRIGKSNLRTLMEMRSFDFYNHTQLCSAKCQSRNYITPKEKDPDRDSRRSSCASQKNLQLNNLFGNPLIQPQTQCTIMPDIFKEASTFSHLMQLSSVLNNNNNNNHNSHIPMNAVKQEHKEELVDVDDSMTDNCLLPTQTTPEQFARMMNTDPSLFWSDMQRIGLLDSVFDQVIQALQRTRDAARTMGTNNVAAALTRVVTSLNLSDVILTLLRSKQNQLRSYPNLDKPRLSSDYSCLEDSSVDSRKRSLDDSVQSQCSPEVKRPRVQYPLGVIPNEVLAPAGGMESKLFQALMHAQLQLSQPPMELLMSLGASAHLPFGDTLLGIKRD